MEKFVAVVFDDDEHAYAGHDALQELHHKGDIAVYASAIIGKSKDGEVSILTAPDKGPIGTAFGFWTGALVGLLAAPVAMVGGLAAAGAATVAGATVAGSVAGGTLGMVRDLYQAGIDQEVVDAVAIELTPGKSCVLASIEEVWTVPLDTRMKEAGGTLFRKPRVDVADEQTEREMAALSADLQALKDELRQVAASARKAVEANIKALEDRIDEADRKIEKRLRQLDGEMGARVDAIVAQIETADDRMREKLEKRKSEIEAEYNERKEKLKRAGKLARQALT